MLIDDVHDCDDISNDFKNHQRKKSYSKIVLHKIMRRFSILFPYEN